VYIDVKISHVLFDHSHHLGLSFFLEFASEGLRTLVLGVKIMTEEKTVEWLAKYKEAATSIEDRDKKMTAVANEVETGLHIVGATAIEDKLQDGVPETISKLEKAGIKLWVLTGDKRETAIEIGYSTKVLTPKMHLTEVVDGPAQKVKTLIAMELMRHIKIGNLPSYQFSALNQSKGFTLKSILSCFSVLGIWNRRCSLAWHQFYLTRVKRMWLSKENYTYEIEDLEEQREADKRRADPRIQRRRVRELAREIIKEFWSDPNNAHLKNADDNDETSVVSDEPPAVFERAKSARESLQSRRGQKPTDVPSSSTIQKLALCNQNIFDEEALSMRSYMPTSSTSKFDNRKRSIFERLFAVDKDVRNGKLVKHLSDGYNDALALDVEEQAGKDGIEEMLGVADQTHFDPRSVKRGLIVEGAALKHILGDPVLEEMLFAVASCSESVIACRVSPIQKALLLKMVRKYVEPTPTTLAIGDGANDVGMIQEAHVGIGISGLEGQQAVNSSDFAIAQFRYLETLLLIHGRWNFMRMSKAVLFFFYKNAALVATMMLFSVKCLHSGTTLYDSWVLSVFNFVGASIPILFMAVFDRDLPRDYVLRNPEVYQSGPRKEFMSLRTFIRWALLCVVHVFTVYYFTAPPLQLGGGVTSAYKGLMGNFSSQRDVGDGEGGDLKVFGTTIFGNLVYVVTLKVSKHLLWDWLGYKVLVVLLTYFAYHRLYSKLDLLSMENSPPSLARRVKAKDGQVEWDILGSE
jgi:magnesium-transporting ATPase (P-type)